MKTIYDVIIVGAGPAGLTSGIYAGRGKLKTLIIERANVGGQMGDTQRVQNYPGFIDEDNGQILSKRMKEQCEKFGVEFITGEVKKLDVSEKLKTVFADIGEYITKTIIYAAGSSPRKLGAVGEDDFAGRGVSYCATCDGAFFTGLPIYVAGSGATAVGEAMYLSKFASEVNIICDKSEIDANKQVIQKVNENSKISIMYNKKIVKVGGDGLVQFIELEDANTSQITKIESKDGNVMGIFVSLGVGPATDLIKDFVKTDDKGYVLAGEDTLTQVDGLFVAGDCRKKPLRQIVTATADGATAASMASKYINNNFK